MKFAVMVLNSQHPGEDDRTVFRHAVDQVLLAESLGFEAVWITEQHFNRYGICPDPLAFAAYLAGITTRIRLGTGVVVLPLHNPLLIAERAALIDQISNGRLDLGIGKGHARHPYASFGINADENDARFEEAHTLLIRAWKEEVFSFDGCFYHVESLRISPRPAQMPHPPLWIATFGNPAVIGFAARHSYPLLQPATGSRLAENVQLYLDQYAGSDPPTLPLARGVYLLPEGDTAREAMRAPARWYAENNPSAPPTANHDLAVHEIIHTLSIVGSPQECVERIAALRNEVGINYLICTFGPGGIPHEEVLASMRLFAEQVMPEFVS